MLPNKLWLLLLKDRILAGDSAGVNISLDDAAQAGRIVSGRSMCISMLNCTVLIQPCMKTILNAISK